MGQVKEINTKNQNHYFRDDTINVKNFQWNILTIDRKSHKEIDIYIIGYITIKKFDDYENIHGVNLLHLIIHSAIRHFKDILKKKKDEQYLILDWTDKYEEVWSGIRSEIKTLNGGKELFYEKKYARIGINIDDDLLLNKQLKFPTLTIIIRGVLQKSEKLYPQIYLDKCLCKL